MGPHMRWRTSQAGQATTEFLVCLLVLAPMFLGLHYLARYADVKHSAIQASRYVAFERAQDPLGRAKSASDLAQEARARFFLQRKAGQQEIAYRDSPLRDRPDSHRIPLWSDVQYRPLLEDFNRVVITERDLGRLPGDALGVLQQKVAEPVFGLPRGGTMRAEVTVSLADVVRFDALRNVQVGLPGATAIAAGAWNASGARGGSESTCHRVRRAVLGGYIEPVMDVLGTLMTPFERHTPDVGIVLPDYVPTGSLRDAQGRDVEYRWQEGNKC